MKNLTIDTTNGVVFLESYKIAPYQKNEFLDQCRQNGLEFEQFTPSTNWETYGSDARIQAEEFGLNISYDHNRLDTFWLTWDGGISNKKGYNTTEVELLSDKRTLTKFLVKIFGFEPQEKTYSHDKFIFPWGYVSSSASLRSTIVSIGIGWH